MWEVWEAKDREVRVKEERGYGPRRCLDTKVCGWMESALRREVPRSMEIHTIDSFYILAAI